MNGHLARGGVSRHPISVPRYEPPIKLIYLSVLVIFTIEATAWIGNPLLGSWMG